MTEQTENLILEHLRAIRAKLDQHSEEFRGMKLRMSSLETQMANVHADLANVHADLAILHNRIDGVEKRLDRIEKKIEARLLQLIFVRENRVWIRIQRERQINFLVRQLRLD